MFKVNTKSLRISVVYFLGLCAIFSCSWLEKESGQIKFIEESQKRGLNFVYHSGATEEFRLPEIMGGGVAVFDSDLDGDLDIYFTQSSYREKPLENHTNALYVNDGRGYFELEDAKDASSYLGYGMGIAVGDIDRDSLPDIFLTMLGPNVLLRNNGENKFLRQHTVDFAGNDWSTATVFADFDLDGDLDLWVVNYIEWSDSIEPECYQVMLGSRDYCSPSHFNSPAQDRVYQNDGTGRFIDVTVTAGVLGTKGNGLGVVTSDFNDDGLIDIFVANDSSPNHLWLNQGNFEFKESCELWNCALDHHGVARAGMGVVATDLDNDRDQDVIVANITTEPDYVFLNINTYFQDVSSRVGLNLNTQRYTRFGLVSEDFNNDGFLDLFEANGAVARLSEPFEGDKYAEPNSLFFGNEDGRFTLLRYSDIIKTSRAAGVGDLDNDGRLDIVVVNRDSRADLLINRSSATGNWLILELRDDANVVALGAKVQLKIGETVHTRMVHAGGSYLTARDTRVHFGLGSETEVSDVQIYWPHGSETRIPNLEANQVVQLCDCE